MGKLLRVEGASLRPDGTLQTKLISDDSAEGDCFSISIGLANGATTIGATLDESGTGPAYVFGPAE